MADAKPKKKPRVIVVTGLSGAGNSTALNALEDFGLQCMDNIPVEVLSATLDLIADGRFGRMASTPALAVCMDARDSQFAKEFPSLQKSLGQRVDLTVLFLTADQVTLARRFSVTRRRHPLMSAGETLSESIAAERALLSPIEESADAVFDTSNWPPNSLRQAIQNFFSDKLPAHTLHLTITSFGFKYGQMRPVDSMFDVRFLKNPFYVPDLKELTGLDSSVADYVFSDPAAQQLLEKIDEFNRFLLPKYHEEGKHYFRIGIGCSGGRHRSVAISEALGEKMLASPLTSVVATVLHRDIDK